MFAIHGKQNGGPAIMTAQLATGNDRIWAGGEGARGVQFDCGYLSPYFITDPERMEVAFENVYILIHEKKISSREDLLPLLEQIAKSGKPLLIIADDVGSEALAALVVNKLSGPLLVAAVRTPGSGDERTTMLQDIARLTGGKAFTAGFDIQLKNIQLSDLGQAKRITIDKNHTLVEGMAKYDRLAFEPTARTPERSGSLKRMRPAGSVRGGLPSAQTPASWIERAR
jgi:chaperonin GroEL (HSP60 family)